MLRLEFVDTLRVAAPDAAPAPVVLASMLRSLDVSTLEPDVRHLASEKLEGRRVGTEGNRLGREYIVSRLREAGLEPLFGESFEQVTRPAGRDFAVNVGGLHRADDPDAEWVVCVAHHDHLGVKRGRIRPGADDNASAVAELLAVGDALGRTKPSLRRHVVLVFPDAEEPPFVRTPKMGSTWFWNHPPFPLSRLRLALVLDLMGGRATENHARAGLENALYVLGAEADEGLARLVRSVPDLPTLPFSLAMIEALPWAPGKRIARSDYHGLREVSDRPFLFLTAGRTPAYHTAHDTADSLDYPRMARALPVVAELAIRAAEGEEPIGWRDRVVDPVADARLLLRFLDTVEPSDHAPSVARKLAADREFTKALVSRAEAGEMVRPGDYRRIQLGSMRYQAAVWSPRRWWWSLW